MRTPVLPLLGLARSCSGLALPAPPHPCAASSQVFGPAFRRNSKWSIESPGSVPEIGDEETSYDDVCKFYDFWFMFK